MAGWKLCDKESHSGQGWNSAVIPLLSPHGVTVGQHHHRQFSSEPGSDIITVSQSVIDHFYARKAYLCHKEPAKGKKGLHWGASGALS